MNQLPEGFIKDSTSMLKTVKEAYGFVSYLEDKLSEMYKKKKDSPANAHYDQVLSKLPRSVFQNRELMEQAIRDVVSSIDSVEKVSLTFAFEPEENFVSGLYEWLQEDISEPFLINYEVDQKIIGGVAIVFRGKYTDLTLSTLVDNYFEMNTDVVQEVLQS